MYGFLNNARDKLVENGCPPDRIEIDLVTISYPTIAEGIIEQVKNQAGPVGRHRKKETLQSGRIRQRRYQRKAREGYRRNGRPRGENALKSLFREGDCMAKRPTYEELEEKVGELGKEVSLRQQAENALKDSEAKYRGIIDNMQDVFYRSDLAGRLILASPSGVRLLGYQSLREILGLEIKSLYADPEDRNLFLKAIKEGGGRITNHEIVLKRKDGTPLPVVTSSAYYYDREGNVAGVEGIFFDITERRQAEKALRESEEKYRNILNNAQVGIFRTGISDSKLLECNDRFAEMFGFEGREECLASCLFSEHYVDAESRDHILGQLREKGEVNDIEIRFYKKDGSLVWLRGSARILSEGGYIDGVAYDITQEKQILEALAESEERYRSIVENIQEGYYEVDIAGNLKFFNEVPVEDLRI